MFDKRENRQEFLDDFSENNQNKKEVNKAPIFLGIGPLGKQITFFVSEVVEESGKIPQATILPAKL